MEKERKLELIQRTLAIKHKLKVHDTLPNPDTHEELSVHIWARWELEDELKAIEGLLSEARQGEIDEKKKEILKNGYPKKQMKRWD